MSVRRRLAARPALLPLAVASASLCAYLLTIAPSVAVVHGSADSAELVTVASVLGVAHPPGAAIWLPLGRAALAVLAFLPEPALRTNVLSAVCMAGAVALVVVAARRVVPNTPPWAAALAGALFATGPIAWGQALITEVLALQSLLAAAALVCAINCGRGERDEGDRRDAADRVRDGARSSAARWAVFGLVLGLLCWNHPTGVVFAIALVAAAVIEARPPPRASIAGGVAFLLPAAYSIAYLALRADAPIAWGHTGNAGGIWAHLSGVEYRGLVDVAPGYVREALPAAVRLTLRQIPPPLWLALPLGALAAWRVRPALTLALLLHAATMVAFVAVYRATGRQDYLATVALSSALFAAWGSVEAWHWLTARTSLHAAARRALAGLAVVLFVGWAVINASTVSLRGGSEELASARALLDAQAPGATIESGSDELTFPLWYLHVVRRERPDVTIVDVRGFAPVIEGEDADGR